MSGVRSLSAHFIQRKNLKILSKPLVSEGLFSFRAPRDLRWEYTVPLKNILLVSHDTVRRYVWTDGQYMEDSSSRLEAVRIVMEQIASWLGGDFQENDTFAAALVPGPPPRIELTPKKEEFSDFITKVVLTLSGTSGVISTVEIREPHGSSTILEFTRVVVNGPIDESAFDRVQ